MNTLPPETATWSPASRVELSRLLLDSIDDKTDVFTPEQLAELDAILDEDERNPGEGRPMEEVFAELMRKT